MHIQDIKGKKVLFFSPAFFRYEILISDKMREMGADVDMYDARSIHSAFNRALIKISPNLFLKQSQKYYEEIINTHRGKDYDYILIIKCDMTPISILKRFQTEFPQAKLCLFLWDSVKNIPGIIPKFKYFDTVHSFDMGDCAKYKELHFLPLFFADQFRKEPRNDGFKYDISFLGTVHSDRYAVIRQVQEIAEKKDLNCYWFLYLQSRFVYKIYKALKPEFRGTAEDIFSYHKLNAEEISEIVDQSRIILDIQHPKQTGLTMRTIEMIGMNKKLITTNQNIKNYDFYNSDNIAVIDRKQVEIPDDFLKSPYIPISPEVYEKYSLQSWILKVLS